MMEYSYHVPVLLKESLEGLAINPSGTYVDTTFGGGGHSRAILAALGSRGRLLAFDQDPQAQQNAIDDERFTLIPQNFRHIKRFLRFYGVKQVDGVLADFGVSSYQFDTAERGFSTRLEGALDMRMNPEAPLSAYEVVNTYEEEALSTLFFRYGELSQSRQIARTIVQQRSTKPIATTGELKQVVQRFLPKGKENKVLAQLYQAIRIEVNGELVALEELLLQLPEIVRPGGRIALISYHSLEDRLVKRFIRDGQFSGEPQKDFYGNLLTPFQKVGKAIVATQEEIAQNNRARSAVLRVAERRSESEE
ncbi:MULTISPECIES: 16S rRNA (cytosine(1402)-N(4))-methyltransferase RsmH [Capnocytophaga]|uniref:16S rRNA (cytosine(1402)-N(4))-methyltransferase RsmH n=1 Tax=Capnocytophaga TaxID=1016 RepID=UPI00027C648F|nr:MULTISPECIES: 16S rRNA (cytosine(1402)-N(4))-methyltransferase RsmH [Capnocytophaga]EJU34646.1 S-adenosyl-methyltransferase MraW [Capnocytophaga sp. CM59]